MDMKTTISAAVDRIETVAEPKKIILFGSAARGECTRNSDIDLLVVVSNDKHRRKTAQKIYQALLGLGHATDVVVVTESDIEKYTDTPGMIISSAVKEGKEIYVS